jgi:hypothetical protein
VGIGAAGIVSTVTFSLFIPGDSAGFALNDFFNTSLLLGLAFGAILTVGLATMAKTLQTRRGRTVVSGTDWMKECPNCGTFIRKRTHFCPNCAFDLR